MDSSSSSCVELGSFGSFDEEIDRLRCDKQVLMIELVKLKQHQKTTNSHLQAMEQKLAGTEMKQQQMMNFLAKALQNPNFVGQIMQQKDKRKELEEAIKTKRRRPIDQGPSNIKLEPQDFGDDDYINNEFDDDLEVAMNMQLEEDCYVEYMGNIELGGDNEGLWEDMLNENVEDEIMALLGTDQQEDDQVHVDILSE